MSLPPLLLLHGALGASDQFEPLVPLLADRFELHPLDFEGHGAAPSRDRPFRAAPFVENVEHYLSEQGIERAHFFGYSLGGYVACMVARQAPERVARVATLATKFLWDEATAAQEVRYLDVETMKQKVPQFAEMLAQRHTASGWEAVVERTRELLWANTETGGLTPAYLAGVEQPVRVMVGDRDRTVGVRESASIYEALPNGELEVLPRTPHPFERVPMERIAASLRDFFAEGAPR